MNLRQGNQIVRYEHPHGAVFIVCTQLGRLQFEQAVGPGGEGVGIEFNITAPGWVLEASNLDDYTIAVANRRSNWSNMPKRNGKPIREYNFL